MSGDDTDAIRGIGMKKILLAVLIGLVMVSGRAWGATFGNVFSGSETDPYASIGQRQVMTNFSLSESGTVSMVTVLCYATVNTRKTRAIIYDNDNSGDAGTPLGYSDPVAITTSNGSVAFTLTTPLELSVGTYWIGIVAESDSVNIYYESASSGTELWRSNNDAANYYTPPLRSNPTEAATSNSLQVCAYATYTTGGGSGTTIPGESMIW